MKGAWQAEDLGGPEGRVLGEVADPVARIGRTFRLEEAARAHEVLKPQGARTCPQNRWRPASTDAAAPKLATRRLSQGFSGQRRLPQELQLLKQTHLLKGIS